jgi:hypothetical protein
MLCNIVVDGHPATPHGFPYLPYYLNLGQVTTFMHRTGGLSTS